MKWELPETPRKRAAIICAIVLVAIAVPVAAQALSAPPASGTIPMQTNSGLQVNVSGMQNMSFADQFPSDNEVAVDTNEGNATFTAYGPAGLNVTAQNLTGEWTNVTNLDVDQNNLTINPEDKRPATIVGDAQVFAFKRDIAVTDNDPDFFYSGASGTTNVTVRGVAPNVRIIAVDQTGTTLGSTVSTSAGVAEIRGMPNSEHTVTLKAEGGPFVDTADPSGNEYLSSTSVDLNATVIDPQGDDFDSVEIQTFASGTWTTVATETALASGDEINASVTAHPGGNTWRVIMNATGNRNEVSQNFSYRVPGLITVYNSTTETVESTKTITGAVQSSEFDSSYRDTVTTTTGIANLNDISPPEEILRSEWSGTGYENQTLVIRDPSLNDTVILHETGVGTTYEQCFSVTDPTGTFTTDNSWVVVEEYVDGGWKTVGSERFDVNNEAKVVLADGVDYRVRLRNENGDLRILGGFTGDSTNGCVPLTVTSAVDPPQTPDTVNTNATCITTTDPARVQFEYNDTARKTTTIFYSVYEYRNESNVLVPNTTFSGSFGEFSYAANIPEAENTTTWTVDVVAQRTGEENFQLETVVCGQRDILPTMPSWLITFAFVGLIWMVAGLFSQLNGAIGGLVVSGLGGIFFFMGLVPPMLGGGVVALSLMTAGIMFIRETRGGL